MDDDHRRAVEVILQQVENRCVRRIQAELNRALREVKESAATPVEQLLELRRRVAEIAGAE